MECLSRNLTRKVIIWALCLYFLLRCTESIDPFPHYHNASLTSKVQRGYSARKGDYPFTAWILTGKKTYHCGASVVDTEWLLTAASCVQDRDLDAYTFVLGDYKVRKAGDGEMRIKADEIILHPRYAEGLAENDVAMVHLPESVNVQQKGGIRTISRVNSTQMDSIETNNRQCLLTGWGYRRSGKLNKKLQFLPVLMQDDSECADVDSFTAGNSMCFSGEPGAPCEADMGSPIACELTEDQWVQVAVTAAGTCSSIYHVATKVMMHETWMASVQARTFCGDPPTRANGQFFVSGVNIPGDSAILVCNEGYRRTVTSDADALITCRPDGTWSTTLAACVPNTGDCGSPPFVANGRFTLVQGTSLAELECNQNYKPSSTIGRFIECQSNGQWTSTSTTCILDTTPGDCGSPPFVANGRFTLVPGTSLAELECNQNYKPSSTIGRFIECQSNGQWTSTSTTCILDTTPGDCGITPAIANGRFTLVPGTSLAVLECNQNYKPSSTTGRFIECQSNRQWSSTSTRCILDITPGDCGNPPTVANGRFSLVAGTSLAVLECNQNYKPSSTTGRFIECQSSGQWTSTSTRCILDTSPGDCINPPTVANGRFTLVPGTTLAVLECNRGYTPSSTTGRFIECQSNGQWSSTSTRCILDTQPGDCGSLPFTSNGRFTLVSGTSLAVLECNQNYKPSSTTGRFIECQSNGQWTSTSTRCILDTTPGDCGSLPFVANGRFTLVSGTSLAVLECNQNYKPSSDTGRFIECQSNGQWSSTSTRCILDSTPGDCGSLPFVANGRFTPVPGTSLAVLECNQNYKPSSTTGRFIECQRNGQWSSTSTRCILDTTPGDCGSLPFISNGRFTLVSGTSLAVLECNQNYKPSSTTGRFIECQSNGQWSSTSTRCILDTTPGDCSNPPFIANGRFTLVPGTSLAVLECNQGFKPSSTTGRFIECQRNGQWSSTSTTCILDSTTGCGSPPFVTNGRFTLVPGSSLAVLECNQNYKPSSTTGRFIECQRNGQWSSTSVRCILDSTPGGCGSTGFSFMAGFPKAYNGRSTPYLYTLTRSPTQVVVTVPFFSQSIPFFLVEAAYWYFDRRIVGHGSYEVATKGIQIQASYPITVIMNQYEPGNGPAGDGTLLHPEICASTQHLVVTADQSSSTSYHPNIMITGTKSNTFVTLELTNGIQKTASLGRYGTFYYSGQHLIGARVFSNHPVIVLAGHQCANIPRANVGFCDYLLEQMPPISSLQRTYILSYMKPRPKYYVRAIATQPNTAVTIRNAFGQVEATFQLNQYSNIWISVINSFTISITATKPLIVAQFGEGTQSDNLGYGDPSMVVHPGVNQWETFYQLYLPNDFYNQHWVIITIRNTDNIGGLRLNYQFLSYSHVTSVYVPSEGNFEVLHVRLYNTVNTLSHVNNARFGVMQYGFNNRVEYSWMAGRLL